MPKPYATRITSVKVMIDALRRNEGKITKVDNSFVDELETLRDEIEKLNSEQEKLKADLKAKTELVTNKLKDLEEKYAFVKKRIKVDIPQVSWKEFGIDASR
ncbi:MAG: membrane-binding protein [Capnocytophaga sp.]|nr:membrane-binding protein [Capnocytophaga sp.]